MSGLYEGAMSVHKASPNSGDVAVTWMCFPISSEDRYSLIQGNHFDWRMS
jgi:hypothetical protein